MFNVDLVFDGLREEFSFQVRKEESFIEEMEYYLIPYHIARRIEEMWDARDKNPCLFVRGTFCT